MSRRLRVFQISILFLSFATLSSAQDFPDLTHLSQSIRSELTALRSLEFTESLRIRYQSDAQIAAFFRTEISDSTPESSLLHRDLIVRAIGLYRGTTFIDGDIDGVAVRLVALIGAYYDSVRNTINFPRRLLPEFAFRRIMSHELAHALQDFHFDLEELKAGLTNTDALSARSALTEGEATLIEILWGFEDFTGAPPTNDEVQEIVNSQVNLTPFQIKQQALANAGNDSTVEATLEATPDYFIESQLGSYNRGLNFAWELKKHGGLAELDQAYANPPSSMEQILHPDKYLAGETFEEITLPDVRFESFASDWELLEQDTLGEFGFLIVFREFDLTLSPANAAEGWGGDQYAVFRNRSTGDAAFVLFTTWDSQRDPEEFVSAYDTVIDRKHGSSRRNVRIEQQGLDVLIAESPLDLDGWFAYLEKVRNPAPIPQPDPDISAAPFDFDGDLQIGFGDFLLFAAAFGKNTSDPDFNAQFDTDGDGSIGFSDFINFASVFGQKV